MADDEYKLGSTVVKYNNFDPAKYTLPGATCVTMHTDTAKWGTSFCGPPVVAYACQLPSDITTSTTTTSTTTNTTTTTTTTGNTTTCEWTLPKEACISGHNDDTVSGVESVEDCIALCKKEQTFLCLSVDYKERQKICQLSKKTSITAVSSFQEKCTSDSTVLFADCLPLTGKRLAKHEVIRT